MISQDFLDILRCPLDPERKTSFVPQEDHLLCPHCQVKYPIKDGFPVLVAEEAQLPPGCESIAQLPCQQPAKPAGAP